VLTGDSLTRPTPSRGLDTDRIARYMIGALVLVALYLTTFYSFNLFHILVELFSALVAAAVFVIAWNTRGFTSNDYLLCLGAAFLFVGFLDILHTLSYEGLNIFTGYTADLPTQLWLAGRYVQALAFIAAPFALGRRIRAHWYVVAFGVLTAALAALIFARLFPAAFSDADGLTRFKIVSEYAICLVLLAGLWLLFLRRERFDRRVFRRLAASVLVTIGSELLFTLYVSPFGPSNLAGHMLKLVAFYLVYRAVVETALVQPYSLLFRELKQSEEALRESEEQQRHIADVLQEALLLMPERMEGVSFGHLYRPATVAARVGGDFYDLFALPGGQTGLLIGDVSGHGLEAAALTSVSKDTIKAFAYEGLSPADVLTKTNMVILQATAGHEGPVQFLTAFYGTLDVVTGRLEYAAAGHPPPLVRRGSGETFVLSAASPVIGFFEDSEYTSAEVSLDPGDLILLYSDGLTEARRGAELFGEERLLATVAGNPEVTPEDLPSFLRDRVMDHAHGRLLDDLAILAVRLEPRT